MYCPLIYWYNDGNQEQNTLFIYSRGGIQLQRYQHQNALAEAYYEVIVLLP